MQKKEKVNENNQKTKKETVSDKSFFEAWMSFESDKITILQQIESYKRKETVWFNIISTIVFVALAWYA